MNVDASGGATGSGSLRVRPSDVAALAHEIVRLRDASGALMPGPVLDVASAAVPGGLLSPACHDLAVRWDREMTSLQQALAFIADALRAAASGYEHTDQAGASAFAGAGGVASQSAPVGPDVPTKAGAAW